MCEPNSKKARVFLSMGQKPCLSVLSYRENCEQYEAASCKVMPVSKMVSMTQESGVVQYSLKVNNKEIK